MLQKRVRKLYASMVFWGFLFAIKAMAATIVLDKNQRAAPARSDLGRNLCATVVHKSAADFVSAESVVDNEIGKPASADKVRKPLLVNQHRNFTTGASGGKFGSGPEDQLMPFSDQFKSNPKADGENIVIRFRGYLNIKEPKTIGFALGCNDKCRFFLGTNRTLITESEATAMEPLSYMGTPVQFNDPGLYPIEVLYFQTSGEAFVELAWSLPKVVIFVDGKFTPIQLANITSQYEIISPLTFNLYSALAGESLDCSECRNNNDCPPLGSTPRICTNGLCSLCNNSYGCGPKCDVCPAGRNFCTQAGACVQCQENADCGKGKFCDGNQTCQTCNVAAYCGTSCFACPSSLPVCKVDPVPTKTTCVQCTRDNDCFGGRICDTAKLVCIAKNTCTKESDCGNGLTCDFAKSVCVPSISCTNDTMCPPERFCDSTRRVCLLRDTPCSAGCADTEFCNEESKLCQPRGKEELIGGGCQAIPSSALGLLALVFFVLSGAVFGGNRWIRRSSIRDGS